MNDALPKAPLLTLQELDRLLSAEFPQMLDRSRGHSVEDVWHGGARVRRAYSDRSLRPGGTIAGATLMALGDFAIYVAVLASIGWVPLAVTTNLTINFLRKPRATRPDRRMQAAQARQAARGRRGHHPLRR